MKKDKFLKNNALIFKSNKLNEMYAEELTIQDLRFMAIYLSKINPLDKTNNVVKFYLSDYIKFFQLDEKQSIPYFKSICKSITDRKISIQKENTVGYINLFSAAIISKDTKLNEWYIEIHLNKDEMVDEMVFDLKGKYFKYAPENYQYLKSKTQIRMYDILKQYEKLEEREIEVNELKRYLGISDKEYSRWDNFRVKVLDVCQQALLDYTDICFSYEKGKSGRGGKWLTIKFHIFKNENYVRQLSFEDVEHTNTLRIIQQPDSDVLKENAYSSEYIASLAKVCNYEFSEIEMQKIISQIELNRDIEADERIIYLKNMYATLNLNSSKTKIENRLAYLIKIIKNTNEESKKSSKPKEQEHSYDLEDYKKLVNNFDFD